VTAKGTVLTEGERAILIHVARGATNQEIADALSLTGGNVKSQLHNACTRLKARNRIEAVIVALKNRTLTILEVYSLDELADLLTSLGPDAVEAMARMLKRKLQYEQVSKCEDGSKRAPTEQADLLTQGERDVLVLVGHGLTNKEIAERMCTSTSTVRTFLYQACTKLSARNRAQAFISALMRQAIRVDEVFTLTEVAQFLATLGPDAIEKIAQLMTEKQERGQASMYLEQGDRGEKEPHSPLTRRERDVIILVARGLTNKEIADRLGTSASTVRSFIYQICVKLEARNRAQAFIAAVRRGAISVHEVFSPDELVELLAASGPEAVETMAQLMRRKHGHDYAPSDLEPSPTNGGKSPGLLASGERDVIVLVARGLTNQEIARRLQISPTTVRTLLHRASSKLAARNRIEAVFFALRRQAIDVQEVFSPAELAELLESLGPDTVETVAHLLRTEPRQQRSPPGLLYPPRPSS
jgi:DNA-binding NarL/FixJ family response regulator